MTTSSSSGADNALDTAGLSVDAAADPREAFAERIFSDVIRTLETLSMQLGRELGLYEALSVLGPATEAQLAGKAGIAERYAREWLEQQAAAGVISVDDVTRPAAERRYTLSAGSAEVLLDTTSPYHLGSVVDMVAGIVDVRKQLLEAYRTSTGVPYAAYGALLRDGIAGVNRPMFLHELAGSWLPALGEVHERLRSGGGRVLDLGCGEGASTLAIAEAYPRATVVGVDLDPASLTDARTAAAGVGDRVTFVSADAADRKSDGSASGTFDLVTVFEALHDMGDPVGALRSARDALAPEGAVLVADERVEETFSAPAADLDRFNYGWSVLHCLPATLAEHAVEANGTVLRPSTVRRWAQAAGFARVDVLDVDNAFWRFYRLSA